MGRKTVRVGRRAGALLRAPAGVPVSVIEDRRTTSNAIRVYVWLIHAARQQRPQSVSKKDLASKVCLTGTELSRTLDELTGRELIKVTADAILVNGPKTKPAPPKKAEFKPSGFWEAPDAKAPVKQSYSVQGHVAEVWRAYVEDMKEAFPGIVVPSAPSDIEKQQIKSSLLKEYALNEVINMVSLAVFDWAAICDSWRSAFKTASTPTIHDISRMRRELAGALNSGVTTQQHRTSAYKERRFGGESDGEASYEL